MIELMAMDCLTFLVMRARFTIVRKATNSLKEPGKIWSARLTASDTNNRIVSKFLGTQVVKGVNLMVND